MSADFTPAPSVIDAAALRAFLDTQRERVFGAMGVVELVAEDIIEDPDFGDRCYGALTAARAQLSAAHDAIYDWIAENLRNTPSADEGNSEVRS